MVRRFVRQLGIRKAACEAGSTDGASYADVPYSLAIAKMRQGEFQQAVAVLRQVETNYGRAAGPSARDDFRMIERMKQAKGRLLLDVALFRTGQVKPAVQMTKNAIEQLSTVQEDSKIQESIRANAGLYLRQGREQLDQMQKMRAGSSGRWRFGALVLPLCLPTSDRDS